MRYRLAVVTALALTIVTALGLTGCGSKRTVVGATAQETADSFAAALEAGKVDLAASAYDYDAIARGKNSDWDSFPPGQRRLINDSEAKDRAKSLGPYAERLGSGIKSGPVAQGNTASLTGSNGTVTIQLRERDGKWYVYNIW